MSVSFWYLLAAALLSVGDAFTGSLGSTIATGERHIPSLYMMEERPPAGDDFITRMFGRFLPKPEDVGLRRYDSVSMPENYPCTKDEWASLLPEDKKDPDMQLVRQVLAKTNMEYRPLKLAYSGNADGWKASIFHQKLDAMGPAVVLARTQAGGVVGGYNPTGWVNLGEYRGSIAAFLFSFPGGNVSERPLKLAKIAGAGMAQIDDGGGPRFGMEGLTISLGRADPKLVRSKLGLYYETLPAGKGSRSLLPGGLAEDFLTDLKVFVGVYDEGERIPYSGALFFQIN